MIDLPTAALTDTAVAIGNTSRVEIDKFEYFGLTAQLAASVKAPLIAECHGIFEYSLSDHALVDKYGFFIFEVVKAPVANVPQTSGDAHYAGDGMFMVSGKIVSRRSRFRPEML